MRKLLFSLLLATSAVTPAVAQLAGPGDRPSQAERRAERAAAREQQAQVREQRALVREQRAARAERGGNSADAAPVIRERRNVAAGGPDFGQGQARVEQVSEPVRQDRRANVNARGRPTLEQRQQRIDAAANLRAQQSGDIAQRRIELRAERDAARRRITPPPGARPDRPAPPPPAATSNRSAPQWHSTWRQDRRYDWRDYRRSHRSRFHLGFYFDPFGWGYQRYGIGWRLWPSYYGSSYWLSDPWSYRLPYAPWPYRWVRYYNDALLVNTITGQVVDVEYNFFW